MTNKTKLNSVNTSQTVLNVTCCDYNTDEIEFPFDGMFLCSNDLVLISDGDIVGRMLLSESDKHALLHNNGSLR